MRIPGMMKSALFLVLGIVIICFCTANVEANQFNYKVFGTDTKDGKEVSYANEAGYAYVRFDSKTSAYLWGNILLGYGDDTSSVECISIEENPDFSSGWGFWTWWTPATTDQNKGGGGVPYYYNTTNGGDWAANWVGTYGENVAGPSGSIEHLELYGLLRMYTSTAAGGAWGSQPLRIGFRLKPGVTSPVKVTFLIASNADTSYDWNNVELQMSGGDIETFEVTIYPYSTGGSGRPQGSPCNTIPGSNGVYGAGDLAVENSGASLDTGSSCNQGGCNTATIRLRYKSDASFVGPFGYGWDMAHFKQIIEVDATTLRRNNGRVGEDIFTYSHMDGTNKIYNGPDYHRGSIIKKKENGTYVLVKFDGKHEYYNAQGMIIKEISYACGCLPGIRYFYDAKHSDRMVKVMTPYGQSELLKYNDAGKVYEVVVLDRSGNETERKWEYIYDGDDLVEVKLPPTPDQPSGSSWKYEYDTHLLTKITDPNGNVTLNNIFENGKVVSQTCGTATLQILYGEDGRANEIRDRSGNITLLKYNENNMLEERRVQKPMGVGEYVTKYKYNENRLWVERTNPAGDKIILVRNAKGKVLENRVRSANYPTDPDLVTTYTYVDYSRLKTVVEPRGNEAGANPDDYKITYYYDFEESTLGDLNNDGITTQTRGNVVKVVYPPTAPTGQQVILYKQYNYQGQVTKSIDGEGFVTESVYEPVQMEFTGRLIKVIQDSGGLNLTMEYGYNEVGNMTTVTDNYDNVTTFEYDNLDRKIKVISPAPFNYETKYHYDATGNLVLKEVQNIDKNGKLVASHPWIKSEYIYDELGYIVDTKHEIEAGVFSLNSAFRDGNKKLIDFVGEEGQITHYTFDERNLMSTVTRGYDTPDTSTSTVEYNNNGAIAKIINALGRETVFHYDGYQRQYKVVDALGHYQVKTLDVSSAQIKREKYDVSDTLLERGEALRDEMGRPYQISSWWDTESRNVVVKAFYDRRGNTIREVDENGYEKHYEYDGAGRRVKVTDHIGNFVQTVYDPNVNKVTKIESETSTDGSTTTSTTVWEYDSLGRLTKTTDNAGNITQFYYDSRGNLTYREDAENNTVTWEYDGRGRNTKVIYDLRDASGHVYDVICTYQEYDNSSRIVSETDAKGNATSFTYDTLDRRTAITYANGSSIPTTYDAVGNAVTIAGFITQEFDELNRKTKVIVNYPLGGTGTTEQTFAYDGMGRTISTFDNNDPDDAADDVTVSYEYDSFSRKTKETQQVGSASQSIVTNYNAHSKKEVVCPSGKTVASTYNSIYKLTGLTLNGDPIVRYTYNGTNVATKTFGNGATLSVDYGANGRVTGYTTRDIGNNLIAGFEYGYDKRGNRLYEKYLHNTHKFADDVGHGNIYKYDSVYRLTNVKYNVADPATVAQGFDVVVTDMKEDFVYDSVGNRVSHHGELGDGHKNTKGKGHSEYGQGEGKGHGEQMFDVGYVVNVLNQYTKVNGISRLHDIAGNLKNDGVFNYLHGYGSRLYEVRDMDNSLVAKYIYDTDGRRMMKTLADGTVTRYYYNGAQVVEERDDADTLKATYVNGDYIDEPIAMLRDGKAYYYHLNALGSVTNVTDENAKVKESYTYLVYGKTTIYNSGGNEVPNSIIGNSYMYTARRLDSETGLYYYRTRYYNVNTGRFAERDPLTIGLPNRLNKYTYVLNNPVNLVDPTGGCGAVPSKDDCSVTFPDSDAPLNASISYTCQNEAIKNFGSSAGCATACLDYKAFNLEWCFNRYGESNDNSYTACVTGVQNANSNCNISATCHWSNTWMDYWTEVNKAEEGRDYYDEDSCRRDSLENENHKLNGE